MDVALATGVFSLVGVLVGVFATTGTQLYTERRRDRHAADRAKRLVAGELLQAQLILRAASMGEGWLHIDDYSTLLPASAWQEYRVLLAGHVTEALWDQLVMAYASLEVDRASFALASKAGHKPDNASLKATANRLGTLRRALCAGGGWLEDVHESLRPRLTTLNVSFRLWLDELGDGELRKDINQVGQKAEELGDLNREFGDNGAWLEETNDEIKRRLDKVNPPSASG
jgi:hypothetical protein